LCHSIVPLYIGLCRALGRSPNDEQNTPLFLRLFPSPSLPPKTDESQYDSSKDLNDSPINISRDLSISLNKKQTLPNFQKLLPRSFSSLSTYATWSSGLNKHDNTSDGLSIISGLGGVNRGSFQSQISTYSQFNDSVNETLYFFFKFGTSFAEQSTNLRPNSLNKSNERKHRIDISYENLLKLLSLAKHLLNKEILQNLDEIALNIYSVCISIQYFLNIYIFFNEIFI